MGLTEKLPKTFSASNREKTKNLKRRIQDDVEGNSKTGLQYFLKTMPIYNFLLPPMMSMPDGFKKILRGGIIDSYMQKELDECKAVNWCRNTRKLTPVKNKGDGNCLLHAVSLFMWGVHDSMLLLRRLLYIALVQDEERGQIKARWRKERGFLDANLPEGCHLNSMQWETEWDNVVESAADQKQEHGNPDRLPYESLEEVHIFVLSNLLRRPIIVLGDTVIRSLRGKTLANNNFVGIYLPLLWKADECIKSPIILGYASNHFVPMVAMEEDLMSDDDSLTTWEAVALVTHTLTFIGVHFLLQDEEARVSNIIQEYMHIKEVPVTQKNGLNFVLSAELRITKLPDKYNLMLDYVQEAEKVFSGKEPVLPSNQQSFSNENVGNVPPASTNTNEHSEGQTVNSYLASRERQQQIMQKLHKGSKEINAQFNDTHSSDKQAHVNCEVDRFTDRIDKVRFSSEVQSKQHLPAKTKTHFSTTDKQQQQQQYVGRHLKPNIGTNKCKTPACEYFGTVENLGYCSTCVLEMSRRKASAASENDLFEYMDKDEAQPASRMDSFELSVTNTDCQYPGCAYVASVYTYPYCHEHEQLSPYFKDSSTTSTVKSEQKVNNLNKVEETKASSLTEEIVTKDEHPTLCRSRSLEESQRDVIRYADEPRRRLCKVAGCGLIAHPDTLLMCTQHFAEFKLSQEDDSQTPRQSLNRFGEPSQFTATADQSKYSEVAAGSADFINISSEPNMSMNTNLSFADNIRNECSVATCKNDSCTSAGNKLCHGYCFTCFFKLDIGNDTDVIEGPKNEEVENTNEFHKKEEKSFVDKSLDECMAGKINLENELAESREQINSTTSTGSCDSKQEGSRADTHEFHKCKHEKCNRLAPPNGTDGFCADCFTKRQGATPIVEPPIQKKMDQGLRVDSPVQPVSRQHEVRYTPMQSCPSISVKRSLPIGSETNKLNDVHQEVKLQSESPSHLNCRTHGCSGIVLSTSKSNSGLCYKCLKLRQEAGSTHTFDSSEENKRKQAVVTDPCDSKQASGDNQQLLRRYSGGRRSGRKRHTIAIPPSLPHNGYSMEGSTQKVCVSPLCNNSGSTTFGGFCQDCYEWMRLRFEQHDINAERTEEMKPCFNVGCEYFGTKQTRGYCSECFRKQQTAAGQDATFGMERRNSSGRSITPPPGSRSQMCANQFCDHYGDERFFDFCPSCFKVFDSCSGISYSPTPARHSMRHSMVGPFDSETQFYPPIDFEPSPPIPPRIPRTGSYRSPANHTPGTSSQPPAVSYLPAQTSNNKPTQNGPTDVTAQYRQTIEKVETASRVGNSKCRIPGCDSYGNSRCQGYCNSCFLNVKPKVSFV